jgi:hypothetical protein
MKATDNFKKVISVHLESVAAADPLFAETLKKENKSIDGCINYIMNTVQKSGCNGFADDEIFNMAMHYYDEDSIKDGKPVSGKVIVNHKVELTPEEIAAAKQKAIDTVVSDEQKRITQKAAKPKKEEAPKPAVQQVGLF